MPQPLDDSTGESPTAHVLHELQLYGFRPFQDEPDPRPLPEGRLVAGALADIFDAIVSTLQDSRLEPDLEGLTCRGLTLIERRNSGPRPR